MMALKGMKVIVVTHAVHKKLSALKAERDMKSFSDLLRSLLP